MDKILSRNKTHRNLLKKQFENVFRSVISKLVGLNYPL
jgi:hypothetical protein